jgi:hypothetical protein
MKLKMQNIPGTVDQALLERSLVESCLPAHLMWTTAQGLRLAGYQLRADTVKQLNVAAAAPLHVVRDRRDIGSKLAKAVVDVGHKVLWDFRVDDPVKAFYGTAMMTLIMVDEGLLADVRSMPVLTSLLLMEDLKETGETAGVDLKEELMRIDGKKLIHKLQKEGYFISTRPVAPAVPAIN